MEITQLIQKIMDSKGITKYKLAKELGVHQTTLKNWFDKGDFTISALEKIADILEVSTWDFLPDSITIMKDGKLNPEAGLAQKIIDKQREGEKLEKLTEIASKLNEKGKDKAIDYVTDLSEQEKYTKPDE